VKGCKGGKGGKTSRIRPRWRTVLARGRGEGTSVARLRHRLMGLIKTGLARLGETWRFFSLPMCTNKMDLGRSKVSKQGKQHLWNER